MIANTQGAYFNDPAIKAKYVERYKAHMIADSVIQGTGYHAGKGCFIGCTLLNYDHVQFEHELNLHEWVGHLADKYFENAPSNLAAKFGLDVLEAIKCGQNIEPVRWKLAVWRHTKQLAALEGNDAVYAVECKAALQQVIEYCGSQINGCADKSAESAAESAAMSAASAASARSAMSAESAAESAAMSAASAESARSAAMSAESAAESAAMSAASARSAMSAAMSAESAAESAAMSAASARSAMSAAMSAESAMSAASARSAAWQEEREMFLQLIRDGAK